MQTPAGREHPTEHQFSPALSSTQVKSGVAAWLGWMFDGLDMHLYTLVALPFVAELLRVSPGAPEASVKASLIQAAFLVGWRWGARCLGGLAICWGAAARFVSRS